MLDAGALTTIDPGANATGAIAVSAPSTTSLLRCCTKAKRPLVYWILTTFLLSYGQITRNRETLEYSWSPALLHQQSAQLYTFLRVEIQEPRCGATFPSHAFYAPIFS